MRLEALLRFFGRFHLLVGGLFLVPLCVGLACGDRIFWPYLAPCFGLELAGLLLLGCLRLLQRKKDRNVRLGLRRREGFLFVAASWILIILYGALPYLLAVPTLDWSSAVFESASAFTTTGATVFGNADEFGLISELPYGILFWRSFGHWVGGMGIIVLAIAILPELAVGGMQLFSAESSGLGVQRLAPRIAQTAKRLWVLYAVLTLVQVLFYLLGDMSLFDSVNHAFATLATGGFSPKDGSIGQYALDGHPNALYLENVTLFFMVLAGINFALQYQFFVRGQIRALFGSTEFRVYLLIFISATMLISADLYLDDYGSGAESEVGKCVRDSSFQVGAILTTTGFGTADFDLWPTFSRVLLIVMMAIGGCGGSTAGGLKVVRLVILLKHAARECKRMLFPRMVKPVTLDRRAIEEPIIWGILGFFALYAITLIATTLLLSTLAHAPATPGATSMAEKEIDLVTSSTAALSALNSIGPGLARVGPTQNFGFVHPLGKLALSFCMLLGRLEIYSLLVLFVPSFWRRR